MRLIPALRAQHLDRMFKRHWIVQGKRNEIETGAEAALASKRIPVLNPEDVLNEKKKERIELKVIGFRPQPVKFDETHPNYHTKKCHIFKDHNVLLEGVKQSMVLTKTIQLKENTLPDKVQEEIQNTEVPDQVHELVKRAIFTSNIFDSYQQLLPKVKDPLRPAYNFPRRLGITDKRKNILLSTKLLRLCDLNSNINSKRLILRDAFFSLPLVKDKDLIQFQLHAENYLVSDNPLKPITDDIAQTENIELYDMYPVKATITIPQKNIYELMDLYPLTQFSRMEAPHTILINFEPTYVHNLHETPVTADQTLGRSLVKSFTVAASYAKKKYGDKATTLPQPITVQCIQTDGRLFDFSILQLNTLDLNGGKGIKNIWYQTEQIPLYENCAYEQGVPTLVGYNPEVIKYLFTFYKNQ